MAPIKLISGLPVEFKKTKNDSNLKEIATDKKARGNKVSSGNSISIQKDTVNISTTGKSLLQNHEVAARYAADMPAIATASEKDIEAIREKVSAGYYFSQDVQERISESLVGSAGNNPVAEIPLHAENAVDAEEMINYLDEVKLKIANGDYAKDEVINAIVDGLLGN